MCNNIFVLSNNLTERKMKMKKALRTLSVLFAALVFASAAVAQSAFTFEDLNAVKRVGDPQLSPDGKTVAFTIGSVDLDQNRTITHIYTIAPDGSGMKQLTEGSASASGPRWSPNGEYIAYTTGGQIWRMNKDGGNKTQITKISTGASNPVWSPDGKWIAFGSEVYPECSTDECNAAEDKKAEESKVKAIVTERLLYRHWVEWRARKRSHVFVVSIDGGTAKDMTPGDFDSPPYAASTGVDYAFSPDGKELAFLRNPDKIEAISTNSDIYVRPVADGGEAKNITAPNGGYDASPVYTSDGKYIIYLSQATAKFESDRWRIMRYNRANGETKELTGGFDRQAGDIAVTFDSKMIYFTAGDRGRSPIFSVPVEPDFRLRIATHVKPRVMGVSAGSLNVSSDGKMLVFTNSSMANPTEVMRAGTDQSGSAYVTSINSSIDLPDAEDVEWTGAEKTPMHGFLLKPKEFDASKKYPMIVLIHGGPQGAWGDNWGYRWNPQMFSNAGYVVFMPNPRGSTGYGQKITNEVSEDWGGRAFVDIKEGVAKVVGMPYVDKERIGAAGASYGGYMVDWLLGHNDDKRFKFKAFVSHAGVYNLESMAGATEELWFVNWEFKGMPWENSENYERWSPHKFADKFDTPTLVTAGEIDYRVPVDQDYQLFTALQLKGVPSKLIVFPDEGHWILKPQNSQFWYKNVLDWFEKYLQK
jgi:dipeptidyl aminopeptidase/acylaminoacyl peptidase